MKEVVISNSSLNCYGYRVLTEGIDLTQYEKNPILLFNHVRSWRDTKDQILPIGTIENLRIEGDNLIGTPVFDETDEFAQQVKSKWDAGILRMASAGLDPIETSDDPKHIIQGQRRATLTKSKLVEVSIVDIGANPDALALSDDGSILELSAGKESDIIPLLKNNMKQVFLKLGLSPEAQEQDALSAIAELTTKAGKVEQLETELASLRSEGITNLVSQAIKDGRITQDKKDHFTTLGSSVGIETLRETLNAIPKREGKVSNVLGLSVQGSPTSTVKLSDMALSEVETLKAENPSQYKKLYKAEYGFEPEL